MKRILVLIIMVVAVVFAISAQSPAESRMSIQGGYGGLVLKPSNSEKTTSYDPFISVSSITRYSLESHLVDYFTIDYTITEGVKLHDYSTLGSISFKEDFGFGYNFDLDPLNIIIGGGFYNRNLIAGDILMMSLGLGVLADVQYDISNEFYLDLSAGYDYGLWSMLISSSFDTYDLKLKNSEYYARLGVGFRFI